MKPETRVARLTSETNKHLQPHTRNTPCDTPNFEFRAPLDQDAEPIAQLFQLVYRESSHPCKDTGYVRSTLHSGRDFWLVSASNGKVVACTAMQRQPWNGVFESCRSVTHPEFRCHGLGGLLYRKILDQVSRRPDFTYVFGFPRTRGMLRLLCADVDLPFVILGHDGAMNVANGRREYHLVGMTANRRQPLRHVIPEQGNIVGSPFLRHQVLCRLAMVGEVGSYPKDSVVGPSGGLRAVVDGVVIDYRFDLNLPNCALELLRVEAPGKGAAEACRALDTFLALHPTAAHVSMNVLIDKEELIAELQDRGFEISAYLPAWYPSGKQRYDCFMLIRQSFTEEPIAHETMDLIQEFRQGLCDLVAPDLMAAA